MTIKPSIKVRVMGERQKTDGARERDTAPLSVYSVWRVTEVDCKLLTSCRRGESRREISV